MDYESIYRKLYEEQRMGVTEEYEKYFTGEFDPDRFNWTDEDEAKSALLNLLDDLYEDLDEEGYEDLLERYEIDEDALRGEA